MKYIILWHYYDDGGKLRNSSATVFEGTAMELQDRIHEASDEAIEARKFTLGYSVVQQIVPVV